MVNGGLLAIVGVVVGSIVLLAFGLVQRRAHQGEKLRVYHPSAMTAREEGDEIYRSESSWLITPESAFACRIGSDVDGLVKYMGRLDEAAKAYFASLDTRAGSCGAIFVAVRPGFISRVWVELARPRFSQAELLTLIARLEALKPLEVKHGPILFATAFDAWGGGPRMRAPFDWPLPLPSSWGKAFENFRGGTLPDDALEAVWPSRRADG